MRALALLLVPVFLWTASVAAGEECACDLVVCLEDVVEEHRQRGWLGAALAGGGGASGFVVTGLVPGGPAERAGLAVGDRIEAVNDRGFGEGVDEIYTPFRKIKPGETVRLTIQPEEGERHVVEVRAEEFPPELLERSVGQYVLSLVRERNVPQQESFRSGGRKP